MSESNVSSGSLRLVRERHDVRQGACKARTHGTLHAPLSPLGLLQRVHQRACDALIRQTRLGQGARHEVCGTLATSLVQRPQLRFKLSLVRPGRHGDTGGHREMMRAESYRMLSYNNTFVRQQTEKDKDNVACVYVCTRARIISFRC